MQTIRIYDLEREPGKRLVWQFNINRGDKNVLAELHARYDSDRRYIVMY